MRNIKFVLFAIMMMAFAACAKKESLVNGMKAEDFYGQFVSNKSRPACNGQTYSTSFASGWIGNEDVVLDMKDDHSFQMSSRGQVIASGSWSVDGASLVFNGVGHASGLTFNSAPALDIQINSDAGTPLEFRGASGRLILEKRQETCTAS